MPKADSSARPALVVVDDRDSSRGVVVSALRRRYGQDYQVVEGKTLEAARDELDRLRVAGADVAIASANVQLDGATEFLAKTRDFFPTARRLILSPIGDNWVLPAISRAAALGAVDHWDYLPASETDEHFLAGIADILVDWAQETGRGATRMTIIGEPGDPAFKVVTDVLQR
jgi:thioredoxin reductase (NADPH)